jgi:hypothetical protein
MRRIDFPLRPAIGYVRDMLYIACIALMALALASAGNAMCRSKRGKRK